MAQKRSMNSLTSHPELAAIAESKFGLSIPRMLDLDETHLREFADDCTHLGKVASIAPDVARKFQQRVEDQLTVEQAIAQIEQAAARGDMAVENVRGKLAVAAAGRQASLAATKQETQNSLQLIQARTEADFAYAGKKLANDLSWIRNAQQKRDQTMQTSNANRTHLAGYAEAQAAERQRLKDTVNYGSEAQNRKPQNGGFNPFGFLGGSR